MRALVIITVTILFIGCSKNRDSHEINHLPFTTEPARSLDYLSHMEMAHDSALQLGETCLHKKKIKIDIDCPEFIESIGEVGRYDTKRLKFELISKQPKSISHNFLESFKRTQKKQAELITLVGKVYPEDVL